MKNAIRRSAEATRALVGGLLTAVPALLGLFAVPLLVLALPLVPAAARPLEFVADLERERVGLPAPRRGSASVRDPATWRNVAWIVVHGVFGVLFGVVAVALWPAIVQNVTLPLWWWVLPPGSVTAFLWEVRTWTQALTLPLAQAALYAAMLWWLVPLAARGQSWLARTLLGPSDRDLLAREVERLTETRTEALESHGAELRRIERDLHDGIQAQLVAVAVRLGLAERALRADPEVVRQLLQDARTGIEDSLGNLRGVIRGIYPPILADRGLGGAVHALASGQRVPVSVHIQEDLPRPPAPIEAAAYFVVAESLTNVTKHSAARHAEVTIARQGADLRVLVRDDGRGGADQDGGTGLAGIRRRVAALDGTATIESPVDGGTTIEVLLPCG